MRLPKTIKSKGEYVNLMPVPEHRGYGAGNNGFVYSFYKAGCGFSYLNMPYKLSRFKLGNQRNRSGYSLESDMTYYDAATIIASAWGISHDKEIIGFLDGDLENLQPKNLISLTLKEYYTLMGYGLKGENNGSAKLVERDVLEIREFRGILKKQDLAKMYVVNISTIKSIWRGETWKHLGIMPKARELSCFLCGKIEVVSYQKANWKFCSTKCKTAWRDRPRFKLICCICKSAYMAPISSYRRAQKGLDVCCSMSCRATRNGACKHNK